MNNARKLPRAKFTRLEPEKAQLTADQEALRKMTASIRNVKTSYVTVKTRQTKWLENKEQLNSQQETLEAKERNQARRQVERTEDGIIFGRDTDGQRAAACSRTAREQRERGYRGDI